VRSLRSEAVRDRRCETGGVACPLHALNATTPLFNESEAAKDSADAAIAQLGNSVRQVVHCETEREEPGIFDFNTIVEDGHAE